MSITILLSHALAAVLAVSSPAAGALVNSSSICDSFAPTAITTPDTFEAGSGKPMEFDASGDIIKVEIYSGDKQTLLAVVEDKDTLAFLNSEESWGKLPENAIVWGRGARDMAAQVSGKEENVFSLYRTTDNGPEWISDIITHTGSDITVQSVSMGGIETYGLFDDPYVSYLRAPAHLLDYLRSLV